MGATRDATLVQQAEDVTRQEVLGTGIRWSFGPCVCVPRDDRWAAPTRVTARTRPSSSRSGRPRCGGFQGASLGPNSVLATAKHYIGDGGTRFGTGSSGYLIDQGDAQVTETELRAVHLQQ